MIKDFAFHTRDVTTCTYQAAINNHLGVLHILYNAGADFRVGYKGFTPLEGTGRSTFFVKEQILS